MKTYPLNEIEKEKYQNVTLCKINGKIVDVITKDGKPVSRCFSGQNVNVSEHIGKYKGEDVKIFAVSYSLKGNFTILVSSYTGNVILFDEYSAHHAPIAKTFFVSKIVKLNELTFSVSTQNEKMVVINAIGETICSGWAANQIITDEDKNVIILHFPEKHSRRVEVINIKQCRSIGTYQNVVFTLDMKHLRVVDFEEGIIDFEGHLMLGWFSNITDQSIKLNNEVIYFYVTNDVDSKLYDKDFNEIINLDKENINLKISHSTPSQHIVLIKNAAKNFNILDKNFKPMFDPWLDSIFYNFFTPDGIAFVCHSEKGFTIMDGRTIKPIKDVPEYVESIVKLDLLSTGYNRYAVKIKQNDCKIFSYKDPITFELENLHIKDVVTDENEYTYVVAKEGKFALVPIMNRKYSGNRIVENKGYIVPVRCNRMFDTYFADEYVIETNDGFNIIKKTDNGVSSYFVGGIDNVYDVTGRFIIVERNGKYAYFDTTKFDLVSLKGIFWWSDIEPAEEVSKDRWKFKVQSDEGKWLEI